VGSPFRSAQLVRGEARDRDEFVAVGRLEPAADEQQEQRRKDDDGRELAHGAPGRGGCAIMAHV
jgi:hypothetical protein